VGVSFPARPREKQQEREEHYQDGHRHHESSHTFFACNHGAGWMQQECLMCRENLIQL
jgi:hypothetical protein